jgi:hypothetical protein
MSEIFGSGLKLVGAVFGDTEFEPLQGADYPYSGISFLFSFYPRKSRSQFLLSKPF